MRGTIVFIALMSFFTAPRTLAQTATPTPECRNTGDVNNDLHISAGDAQLTFSIALGLYTPTYEESCAADCNGNDQVTAADAQAVFKAALGSSECSDPLTQETPTPTQTQTPMPTNFVYVPAGTFQMGSPSDEICREGNEGPVHTVTLSHGFYIQTTEVTQQQWVDIFGNNPANYTGMNRPVEEVSWFDCCIYCNRLSQAEGLTPCYYADATFTTVFDGTPPVTEGTVFWNRNANGYRLPTEAEWEYACRAGTTTAYNSGWDNSACYEDQYLAILGRYYYNGGTTSQHAEVKSYQPNNWGLYDMHGNVCEWCWDWSDDDYYNTSPNEDPTGPSSGLYRITRGGGFFSSARFCRSAYRSETSPGAYGYVLGFRVLRTAP